MPRVRKPRTPEPGPPQFNIVVDSAYHNQTHEPLVSVKNGETLIWCFGPADARAVARLLLDKAAESELLYTQKQTIAHVEQSINQTIQRLMQRQPQQNEAQQQQEAAS